MPKSRLLNLIGGTPVVKLTSLNNSPSMIFAKLDYMNPSGSIKDVMAAYMIKQAEEKGILKPNSEILEVTTGNTGIAFAMLSSIKGYKFTAVMPEHMSIERQQMMRAFGAKIVLTPKEEDIPGAISKYNELVKQNPQAWLPRQFENKDNIRAHMEVTGKEILNQVYGKIDYFVAGVGTGGTLMGVAKILKKSHPEIKIVAVEPSESAVMSGQDPKIHGIQGIGEGFIPPLMDMDLVDEVIQISTNEAEDMAKQIAHKEGLLVGISSGANVLASLRIAERSKEKKIITTILPDRGERYLSMGLFR